MKNKNVIGEHAWAYESEKIAALPDNQFSIGVGADLMEVSGLDEYGVVRTLRNVFDQLGDYGVSVGLLGDIRCYILRRGKALEIGTRKDFADLEYGDVCDLLDQMYP